MSADRLITVAIHTYDRAIALKKLLEREGVSVTLQNVNLSQPVISSGVRIRIQESDLPMALRIIENQDIFASSSTAGDDDKETPVILVPVDFSEYSTKASEIAFKLAYRHKASITLLHTYTDPVYSSRIQLNDMLTFDGESEDVVSRIAAEKEAHRQMELFCNILLDKIKAGTIPAVKFTSEITEGLPEDSINQFAKTNHPLVIVMGTRGADTKERELVGSVTAEVLDTCRYPVFTVPDSVTLTDCADLKNIVFLSNFDQEDILALDALFHLLPVMSLNITLVKIPSKKRTPMDNESLNALGTYCRAHYPDHHFSIDTLSMTSIDDDFMRITSSSGVHLIAVPNKKKSILARLFNPGIAHRLLFHSDIPMMVIPV